MSNISQAMTVSHIKNLKISKRKKLHLSLLNNTTRDKPSPKDPCISSYQDPWFYNSKNLDFQIESMRTSAYLTKQMAFNPTMNNTFNSFTITENSTLPSLIDTMISKKTRTIAENNSFIEKQNNEFLFRKIFESKGIFRRKQKFVDNKLNIRYADTEDQYELRLSKENKKLISQGKPIKHYNKSDYLDKKLNFVKNKIIFMKGVVDYGYPKIAIAKIREIDKTLKERDKIETVHYYTPCKQREMNGSKRNEERKMFLTQAFKVNHIKNVLKV